VVRRPRKTALLDYLAAHGIAAIGAGEWDELLREMAPVSESYLRELVRGTGLPFAQPYAGIRQKTFDELDCSLREMLEIYAEATARGDRAQARYCRRQVIAAKDRARLVARNSRTTPDKKAQKQEMVQWMLVWLENPVVFPVWLEIRRRYSSASEST
jgi:hypothetical protein